MKLLVALVFWGISQAILYRRNWFHYLGQLWLFTTALFFLVVAMVYNITASNPYYELTIVLGYMLVLQGLVSTFYSVRKALTQRSLFLVAAFFLGFAGLLMTILISSGVPFN